MELRRSASRGTTPRLVIATSGAGSDGSNSLSSAVKEVVTTLVGDACKHVSFSLECQTERESDEQDRKDQAQFERSKTVPDVLTQQAVDLILQQYTEPPHTIDEVDVLDIVAQVDCTFRSVYILILQCKFGRSALMLGKLLCK